MFLTRDKIPLISTTKIETPAGNVMDNFKEQRQMNYKKGNIEISYPFELIDNRNNIPSNHVSPCSVLLNNEEIGGIFIACPSQDIEYFRILQPIPPEPPLKFRMLNFENRIFVITQIHTYYHQQLQILIMKKLIGL